MSQIKKLKEITEKHIKCLDKDNLNKIARETSLIQLKALERFSNVYLEDSTQIELSERLSEEFKGMGGSASKSSIKLDVLYEATHHLLKKVFITGGSYSDQKNGAKVLNEIQEGDLIIRDLGYFDLSVSGSIQEKKAYYLSRLFKGVKVYLSPDSDAEAIDLVSHVKKRIDQKGFIDMRVYLGEERICSRLVAYCTPETERAYFPKTQRAGM
ncbi:MAG: transposase [Candidatus Kuenenia sp.]|nr:transposase [Candidatus Kuenenia hertensis]